MRLNERFTILRRLGAGASGVVFEALDALSGQRVALKQLRQGDAAAAYHFKRQFRVLAGLAHPHLVPFHELLTLEDRLYVTMDLVQGVDFLSHVRGLDSGRGDDSTQVTTSIRRGAAPEPPIARPADARRLRPALVQLVEGVCALHALGHLHRDLKPANVLVTAEGRLLILDFGLLASLAGERALDHDPHAIIGTPAYMAPEQAAGETLSAAADWYAVGTMLYEALTGRLPVAGQPGDILARKRAGDAPPADPGLDGELGALCRDLLAHDPRARPDGGQVRARLGLGARAAAGTGHAATTPAPALIGRGRELDLLHAALAGHPAPARPAVVQVDGPSGIGKSALIRAFLAALAADGTTTVLSGRCSAHEDIPFKAMDAVVENLAAHLLRLPDQACRDATPDDIHALVRVFPVLGQVESVRGMVLRPAASDSHEQRRRAFAALRVLLGRLAAARPLVIALDDVQWGDSDSAALLSDVLAGPRPPALLLILGWREGAGGTGGFLESFAPWAGQAGLAPTRLTLAALPDDHALAVARGAIGAQAGDAAAAVRALDIARDSRGIPFFIHELAKLALPVAGATLAEILAARTSGLDQAARDLLRIIAVSGRPLPAAIARRAAALGAEPHALAETTLRMQSFVRLAGPPGRETIDVLHDRIREAVLAGLAAPAVRDCHQRLAAAFASGGAGDPETLAIHYHGAGDDARTRLHCERAGDDAAAAFAFGLAARLYRLAVGAAEGRDGDLRIKLAGALASAGRGNEAGDEYLAAWPDDGSPDARQARRCAAEQHLRCGRIDDGLAVLAGVLRTVGMRLPRTPGRALLSLLGNRLRLALRGLDFRPRPLAGLSADERFRIDVCWMAGHGLASCDLLRSADFQSRHLLLALRAGEPYRVARAFAWEALLTASEGDRQRAADIAGRALTIAERIADPHALAWAKMASVALAWAHTDFVAARERSGAAMAMFRAGCVDIAWELGSLTNFFRLQALYHLGELPAFRDEARACAQEAAERGDLYTETTVRTHNLAFVWLMSDQPAEARRETATAIARWSQADWHVQHWADMMTQLHIDIYEGHGVAAHARITGAWPRVVRAQNLRIEHGRVQMLHMRGRAALAAFHERGQPTHLRDAAAMLRGLERERLPWARPFALALRAGIASASGERERAIQLLEAAGEACARLDLALYRNACARQHGALVGGVTGRIELATADTWFTAQGVVDAGRWADMLVPVPGVPTSA